MPTPLSAALTAPLLLTSILPAQLTLDPVANRTGVNRQGAFAFYDAQRGRVTLVGGQVAPAGGFPTEILQYEGIDEVQLATLAVFPPRAFGATAADGTGTVILFGGQNPDGSRSDETWRWDPALPGVVQMRPASAPPARSRPAMALLRGQDLVLFGGASATRDLDDTWLWRGGSWQQVFPAQSPPPRSGHTMAFDPFSNQVVLFGGQNAGTRLGDTWSFDGTTWTQLPISGPSPRLAHMMALDEARAELVLFGGDIGPSGMDSGETWLFRRGAWHLAPIPYTGFCSSGMLVHDPRRQLLLQAGGAILFGSIRLAAGGMRTWDGSNWAGLPGYGGVQGDGLAPSQARDGSMVAFCASRRRITAFGGQLLANGPFLDETLESDGASWVRRQPRQSPGARRSGAMAGDGIKQFLFGGEDSTGRVVSDDLWVFDGSEWNIAPTGALRPPPRTLPVMAFDARRNCLVLYSGLDANAVVLGDVWEYDVALNTWAQSASTPPPARLSPALAYDSGRRRIVLHGGQLPGPALSPECWSYDGQNWLLMNNSGPALEQHSMALDAARGVMVVAGGQELTGFGFHFNSTTWETDGRSWNVVATSVPLIFPILVFDSGRQAVLAVNLGVFGPLVARWDGVAWGSASGVPLLGARSHHSLTFDPLRQVSVLLGGIQGGSLPGDWWDWDQNGWRRTLPVHPMPAREGHAACWSPLDGKVMVFGGRDAAGTPQADTWLLDAAQQDWLPASSPGPSARAGHALCLEEPTGQVLLFGGSDGSVEFGDTWLWRSTSGWTRATGVNPPARREHAMAWHAPSGHLVLFGGADAGGVRNDTWHWTPRAGWAAASPAHVPPARLGHTLTFDPVRGRLVLSGGEDTRQTLGDLWEYDGTDWTQRVPETAPLAATQHAVCFDPGRGRVLLSAGASLHQLWSNVDPGGDSDLVAPTPLAYRSQPVLGNAFRLAFPVQGVGLLFLAPGPATAPLFVLPAPLACHDARMFVDASLFVVTTQSEVLLPIPADVALAGARITLQALGLNGGCLQATDALNAVLLTR